MSESGGTTRKGFILAAPASYSGKTLIMLALLRHFANQNTSCDACKVGT